MGEVSEKVHIFPLSLILLTFSCIFSVRFREYFIRHSRMKTVRFVISYVLVESVSFSKMLVRLQKAYANSNNTITLFSIQMQMIMH